MGDMFRSEEMALCQMFIQPEAAYASIAELGETGCVQFRDLNGDISAYQRKFVNEVRRCDNLERQIRYIKNELKKDKITLNEIPEDQWPKSPNLREIIELETQLETIEDEIRELAENFENLNIDFSGLTELRLVLENTENFFSSTEVNNLDVNWPINPDDLNTVTPPQGQQNQRDQLGFVAGVIKLERFFAFERMLWRISRGNVFVKRNDLTDPLPDLKTGEPTIKTVFVAFFQGEQLKQRIKKICAGFHAAIYPCPSSGYERQQAMEDLLVRLMDLKLVLNQTADHRNRMLINVSRLLPKWTIMVKKAKAIYHTLNCFNVDVSNKCLIGEGWVPKNDLLKVQNSLERGSKRSESTIASFLNIIKTNQQPPTYTRTNKFTRGFQNLIDAYGMASYREVNPALYTCITFPFLFAVMFGDIGHAFVLIAFAGYLVWKEKELSKIKEEIFNIFFGGRYIILLMGLFSVYTGFIYNDIFSKSMNIFGSAWKINYTREYFEKTVLLNKTTKVMRTLDPRYNVSGTYTMGLDPVWQLADNKIIFLNTYKMKLSIVFGVLHMMFGVCMSLINFNYFKNRINIILEFVPQILFLILLFGYMVFMMFFKWFKYDATSNDLALTPGCAPSILILFINMMLFKHQEPLEGCKEYMFEGQEIIQMIFVFVALICIPWMLLGKPLYIMWTRKKAQQRVHMNGTTQSLEMSNFDVTQLATTTTNHDNHEEEPISEIFIHQAIHTIEYVLSTISHTASYLRLWALSLAHAQLSEVLWNMIFAKAFIFPLGYIGAVSTYIIFMPWACLTVGILVLIEGLSAFLHTLRLHWVEFMSKFYEGLGYEFQPFYFKNILENKQEESK